MTRSWAATALWIALLVPGLSQQSRSEDKDTCISCHAEEDEDEMVVPVAEWRESIHAEASNTERVEDEMVELILEAGYNFSEEHFEAAREAESQEGLLRRIKDE